MYNYFQQEGKNKMKRFFIRGFIFFQRTSENHISLSIIIAYNLINVFFAVIFYHLIPILLNYPPVPEYLDSKWVGYTYTQQWVFVTLFLIVSGSIFLALAFSGIGRWKEYLKEGNTTGKVEKINLIKRKCINVPYFVYLVQIISPALFTTFVLLAASFSFSTTLKIMVAIFSFSSLLAIITLLFSKKLLSRILLKTYMSQDLVGKRIGLRKRIFLQVIPLFVVAILFTSLFGYSRIIEEKGNLLFDYYKLKLSDMFNDAGKFSSIQEIKMRLKEIDIRESKRNCFMVNPKGDVETLDGSLNSEYFLNYLKDLSPFQNGRVYDMTGEIQGAMFELKGLKEKWIVGVTFKVASNETINYFFGSFLALLVLNAFVLSYFSKSLSEDISLVAESLSEIAEGESVNLDKKLPVTSNDEIGDLVIAFNKIQEREKEHIKSIKENQAVMMEQERLASLGQLIGGIAHNLKTPIMSLAGGLEGLKDLIAEYKEAVGDQEVTEDDHREIAGEMMEWVEKMRPHCAYMSDIITAVKGQAVQLNASTNSIFTVDELINRVEILMKHEINKNHCKLSIDVQVSRDIELKGEVSSLIQVMDNLVINSIAAYEGQGGEINLDVVEKDHSIVFSIRDRGMGMPKSVQDKLFKEMITTKGKKGTGLGLYMSYSTIKGRFGGNMWFESEENKGTTFYISIPYQQGNNSCMQS
ncbi:MAG: HAMP domain-containing histidine kinase [Clostridia bacterium]|nr:HAMP domain-containing histidine kinase [Clostridia bacterium]